ncbi:MAG: hypothetical protein M3133_04315, partial [Actinomycetota bacterium]|nr:hypothetical protein [Actinomycetota bacterium]
AAGTLNTLRLLFAARDRLGSLPGLSPALGRDFSANGDAVSLLYRTGLPTESDVGPAINVFVRVRDAEGHHRHAVGEAGLPLNALPLPGWLRQRLRRSAVLFAYGRERSGHREVRRSRAADLRGPRGRPRALRGDRGDDAAHSHGL